MRFFPAEGSQLASRVDLVALVLLVVCLVLAVGIFLCTVYFVLRYHESRPADRSSPPVVNVPLEIGWIAVPTLLGLVLFGFGAQVYYEQFSPRETPALELEVVGEQWMWLIRYPNGYKAINDVCLPRGRVTRLRMISQDVIHSFSLPDFRIKRDVLPGRYVTLEICPDKVGASHLFCAEYCGTDHASMGGTLTVLEPEEFDRWMAAHAPQGSTPLERGRRLYRQLGCISCHGPSERQLGPRLEGVYGRVVGLTDGRTQVVDEDYLRKSILNPAADIVAGYQPVMPTYQGRLNEEQLLDLLTFLREGAR